MRGDGVNRNPKWTLAGALALVAALGLVPGCREREETRAAQAPAAAAGAVAQRPSEPAGPPSPEVQAAVQAVIASGRHPWLTWPEVPGVLPDLKALYAAEPDGLFWFAGETAHPTLGGALETIAHCDTQGLVPADYDAALLAQRWAALSAGTSVSPTDRALFDMALTIAAMRLGQSAHWGRVDPRLVGFDYDVSAKRLDLATALRSARDAGGLPDAIAAAEPQFPVYRRLVKALADYRALAAAGEPEPVPALDAKKVELGKPWTGATALAARAARPRRPAGRRPGARNSRRRHPLYAGALVDAVKRFQDRHALEADGVIGARHDQGAERPRWPQRVQQIELALERMRWLPELHDEPHIFVNVPLSGCGPSTPVAARSRCG